MDESIYARYVGGGDFVPGVPMRDMTLAEWEAVSEELRALVLALGLYQIGA